MRNRLILGVLASFLPLMALAADGAVLDPNAAIINDLIKEEAIKLSDLGLENPGLLQTNPFYFVKSWRRITQRTFTFNAFKKADLELDILSQKASEIKRLADIGLQDEAGFLESLDNYQYSLGNLQFYLDNLKENEVEKLLPKLLDASIKHSRLFQELRGDDLIVNQKFNSLSAGLSKNLSGAVNKLKSFNKIEGVFTEVLERQPGSLLKEIKTLEALEDLAGNENRQLAMLLVFGGENLAIQSLGKISAAKIALFLPGVFANLPGEDLARIKTLDYLREFVSDSELKNELSVIRQNLLDFSLKNRQVSKADADQLLKTGGFLIETIDNFDIKSGKSFNEIFSRAQFNLKQAQESFETNQYGAAFGQASAALAAAKNALGYALLTGVLTEDHLDNELKRLKEDYDRLFKTAKNQGPDEENSKELFVLLSDLQKFIAKVADANKKGNLNEVFLTLREAKQRIAFTSQILNKLILELEKSAKEKRASQPLLKRVLKSE